MLLAVKAFLREMARASKPRGIISIIIACGKNKFTLEYMLEPSLGKFIDSICLKFGHIHTFGTENLCELLKPYFTEV